MSVVAHSTQAVDYHHKGSTKVDMKGTDLASEVRGEAKVEGQAGGVKIEAEWSTCAPQTRSVWHISPMSFGRSLQKEGRETWAN